MGRPARRLFISSLIGLGLLAQQGGLRGTWGATDGSRQLVGRWTARVGGEPGTASGTWEVVGREGEVLAYGTWSLRKETESWSGSWAARALDGRVFSGEWTADTKLPPSAEFTELLASALAQVATGTWQMGNHKGSWSIRTGTE